MNRLEAIRKRSQEGDKFIIVRSGQQPVSYVDVSRDEVDLLLAMAEAAINCDVAEEAELKFRLSAWYAETVEGDSEKAFRAYMDASERTRAARGAYEAAIAPLLEEAE